MDATSLSDSHKLTPRASSAPVLAIVVVKDDAPDLEVVLTSLVAQDHQRTEVLVIDIRRDGTPTVESLSLVDRVAIAAPASLVVQASGVSGFGQTVNAGLEARATIEPALPDPRFLLFVSSQVVLGDTAVRRLVERAVETNVAVVGPKVVGPTGALEETGWWFDALGSPVPVVPDPEFDQGQYDTDLSPDAVSGAAWMIRYDLFVELDGLDPDGVPGTEHLDLCRRARAAGASIGVVPAAVARRFGSSTSIRYVPAAAWPRFRLRQTLASPYSRLLRLVPVLVVATLGGVAYGLLAGRFRHAFGLLAAWPWNLRRIRSARQLFAGSSALIDRPDCGITGRRESLWVAFRRVVTGRTLAGDDDQSDGLRRLNGVFGAVFGPGGLALLIAAGVIGFGSRSLVSGGITAVGRFQGLPDAPSDLLAGWWNGWRSTGTGTSNSGTDGLAVVGFLAGILPGSTDSLWTALVLGAFAVGALGTWRLVQPIGGGRSRAVAVLVYLAAPIPYDALRSGRLTPLAAYALLPWVARRLAGAQAMTPYGFRGGEPGPGTRLRSIWSDVLVTGLAISAVIAVVPVLLVPVCLVAGGLFIGTIVSGATNGLVRLLMVASSGAAVSALVHLPTILTFLGRGGNGWAGWLNGGVDADWGLNGSIGLWGVLALDPAADRATLTWALFVLPLLSLLSAQGRHLSVVVRAWFVTAAGASGLVAIDQGWIGGEGSVLRSVDPAVFLVPVALGLAWASAAGVAGIGADLAHLARQVHVERYARAVRNGLLGLVVVSLTIGVLPVLTGSFAGSWGAPRADLVSALPSLNTRLGAGDTVRGGDARVLWIGEQVVLPAAGIPLSTRQSSVGEGPNMLGDLVMAVTDGRPDLADQWSPGETAGMVLLRDALNSALDGATHRLGVELGRWGVAQVVVVQRSAPVPGPGIDRPVPDRLTEILARQLDLERVEAVNRAMTVYRNTAVEAPFSVVRDRNRRVVPALVTRRSFSDWVVEIPADGALRSMVGPDDRWQVRVDGQPVMVLAPGEAHGVIGRPAVRVATGSVATFEVDSGRMVGRRGTQLALAGLLILLTSWARTSREASISQESSGSDLRDSKTRRRLK
ncbi:MAG: glycosyltransferase [Acidimicrobiales bacterium]|nr:glycosyltransferase [Acidimicrobiales bacterium]